LYESGLVGEPIGWADDARTLEWGIGLTNMVDRASASVSDLSLDELRAGAKRLRTKLERYAPRVVCFNGKRIYEVFAGRACGFGLQPERIGDGVVFVMPSTSARTVSYQRAAKRRFFEQLRAIVEDVRASAAVAP
jgi:TDG/mug DNA glycosylase family protein